jgi:hypothetical protein
MEVESIENLKTTRDLLKNAVKTIKVREFEGKKFGSESEYDARGVLTGVESIITDIRGLLRAPKRFLQCSNYSERVELNRILSSLKSSLNNMNLVSVCNDVEMLKPTLRGYSIRYTDERLDEFIDRTNELQKKAQALSEVLSESKEAHTEILEIVEITRSLNEDIETQNNTLIAKKNNIRKSYCRIRGYTRRCDK